MPPLDDGNDSQTMNHITLRSALATLACALLHVLALAQPAASCPPAAAAPSAEQVQQGLRDAQDRGFLWRLRKAGHTSYLYGTVHVAKLAWVYPGATVAAALQASDTVALELDVLDPDVQERMAQGTAATHDTALPTELQQRLNRQAAAECVPLQALAGYQPEMQIAALTSLVGRRDGLDPAYGIDIFLAGWARGSKKPVVSLETPELQLGALKGATRAETLEFVDSALAEMESGRAAPTLQRIAQVWADGDLATLARYEDWCDCVKTPADRAAMARLLDARNPALADRIAALHAGGQRVFAAVGSLHMAGPLALPALMAQRGFQVEAVAFPRR
jgi:uncharacterized protein YbaP (TraB family)